MAEVFEIKGSVFSKRVRDSDYEDHVTLSADEISEIGGDDMNHGDIVVVNEDADGCPVENSVYFVYKQPDCGIQLMKNEGNRHFMFIVPYLVTQHLECPISFYSTSDTLFEDFSIFGLVMSTTDHIELRERGLRDGLYLCKTNWTEDCELSFERIPDEYAAELKSQVGLSKSSKGYSQCIDIITEKDEKTEAIGEC